MAASYAPAERQYYDQLFNSVDKDGTGVIAGQDALPFLTKSNLSPQILGEIWALSDPENNGFLTKEAWYRAARLIGWMQKGNQSTVEDSLAMKPGPYPTFAGQPPPPPAPSQPLSAAPTGASLPALTPADKTKFTKIFVGCGPQNGLVNGDKARDVFVKSQLSYDKLAQIWNLADTQQRGSLDLTDFVIGMYLIQSSMANPSLQLPATLPKGLYEQASGGRGPPPPVPPVPSSPVARQNTGPASPIRPQYTGGALQPQRTGQSIQTGTPPRGSAFTSAFTSSSTPSARWDVTPEAKATSDRFFAQLDTQGLGVIEGDVAVPFMLQSQLDEGTLATIWDLSDIRHEGKLDKDQFAVAMHLINLKLAGKDLPSTLPNSLIPPALRSEYGGGQQEVLSGPSSTTKDLFDLFADDPPAPAPAPAPAPVPTPAPAPSQPQPFSASTFLPQQPSTQAMSPAATGNQATQSATHSDLLGDDSAESPQALPDNSAEIGNKRNQLENTNRNLSDLEKTHGELQDKSTSLTSELEELESKLSSAKVRHEAETKAVADLRTRVGDQQTTLHNLNAEFIAAESDLSAMKSEKDELEQALLRDKEEVRGLQRKMKDIEEEKATLKGLLEKMKKEARQQKGMVTIAKKQLSTAESSRDGVQKELDDVEKERLEEPSSPIQDTPFAAVFSPNLQAAASVPLPATPKALSPTPTGASGRSNNPFDRLRSQAKPAMSPRASSADNLTADESVKDQDSGVGSAVGETLIGATAAAAGVVVAGATTLYDAAKEAVIGEERDQPTEEEAKKDSDPFGAPTDLQVTDSSTARSPEPARPNEDAFGAQEDTDPFGAPPSSGFANDNDGFGDSFTRPAGAETAAPKIDLDSGFDDFEPQATTAPVPEGIPAGVPKSALPNLRPEAERTMSTQAVAPTSTAGSPRALTPVQSSMPNPAEELISSDEEDEGPEDLEQPARTFSSKGKERQTSTPLAMPLPVLSPPVDESVRARRSAPPPPASKSSLAPTDDFDPFGAPAQTHVEERVNDQAYSLPPGAAPAGTGPKAAKFEDDDDFDFSDLPPAQVDTSAPVNTSAPAGRQTFDDEFAGFDDEFENVPTNPNSGSENSTSMTKSYEMVSPSQPSATPGFTEWGLGESSFGQNEARPGQHDVQHGQAAPASGFSFDDAFGGDFAPAPATESDPTKGFAPPAGPPPQQTQSSGPPLPVRRETGGPPAGPQPDDLEDVKKLCGMGFPRDLVVGALDANGYDFQKALNVLLSN